MKKETKPRHKRRINTSIALMIRFAIILHALSFAAMSYLTVWAAIDFQDQWESHARTYTSPSGFADQEDLPGYERYEMVNRLESFDILGYVRLDWPLFLDLSTTRNMYTNPDRSYEVSMSFFDSDGNLILNQGQYAYLTYINEESWHAGSQEPSGYTYIDGSEDSPGHKLELGGIPHYWGSIIYSFADIVRLTGYFEGQEFVLLKVSTFSRSTPANANSKPLAQLDLEGRLKWDVKFDETAGTDRELVNIYTDSVDAYGFTPTYQFPVEFGGESYEFLNDLLADERPTGASSNNRYSLWETVLVHGNTYTDLEGQTCYYNTAIRCYPLLTAMEKLLPMYIAIEFITIVILLSLWLTIKFQLKDPLRRILWFGKRDLMAMPESSKPKWKELYELEQGYIQVQQTVHRLKLENRQLQVALDYVRDAEENRRTLVSNITHELKTPLAIIHSYAEGLKEGIAVEKQEQYLDIILEETQRMDAMVLQMLDLSRLEAGKVQLAADRFSPLELTRSIFDRLHLVAEEKNLTVHYDLVESFEIVADEGRIGQVITNFATNAIKYTPEGGNIWIKIYQHRNLTYFAIENEGPPLPQEVLEQVWDSFYRAETSRTTSGTGLGLAISRAIIHLHRGSCEVRNTQTGVEFRFVLP